MTTNPDEAARQSAPWWSAGPVTLYTGDAHDVLAAMPDASADCVVTSPPYWGKRRYQTGAWRGGRPGCGHPATPNPATRRPHDTFTCPTCGAIWIDRQYGLESTIDDYIDHLVAVFAQARRVLHPEGTLWLNLGDTYASGETGRRDAPTRYPTLGATQPNRASQRIRQASGIARKNLIGLPWRVALALQSDNWILRSAAVWAKNAMPESVQDRLSSTYEMVFLLTRSQTYFFDLDAIRVPHQRPNNLRPSPPAARGHTSQRDVPRDRPPRGKYDTNQDVFANGPHGAAMRPGRPHNARHPLGKNPGDVWRYSTRPLKEAHFAAFPIDIPLRCIAAGCRPGGTVLDPFSGAATTGLAALQLGRRYTGIDLSETYTAIARERISRQMQQLGMSIEDKPAAGEARHA